METTASELSIEKLAIHSSSRKRAGDKMKWKRNVKQVARQKGMEYVNCKGNIVPAKKANAEGNLCMGKCHLKCNEITGQQKNGLFNSYYGLDENRKNTYLFGCKSAYKQKVSCTTAEKHRKYSFFYSVTVDGSRRRVCKAALCHIHVIGNKNVSLMCRQVASGQHTAHPIIRGKHVE